MKKNNSDELKMRYVFNSERFWKFIGFSLFSAIFFWILWFVTKTEIFYPIICTIVMELYLFFRGSKKPYEKDGDPWLREEFYYG